MPQDNPAARQVAAQSHPGLLVLKRAINPKTGKLMTVLSVDEIRRLADFFGMTSGAGGWRVAIVDTADDMNDNAANALLKMLEEPPAHAMLLLLSNTPGRLLPTIRSRCQRLDLRPLDDAHAGKGAGAASAGHDGAERAALARLSGGSIGAALTLATGEGAALAQEADRLIEQARDPGSSGAADPGRQAVPHARRAGAVRRVPDRSAGGPHSRQARIAARRAGSLGRGCWAGWSRASAAPPACIWSRARRCSARRAICRA